MKKILFLFIPILTLISCSNDEDNETQLPEELNFTGGIMSCSDFSVKQLLDSKNLNISLNISGSGREELNLTSEYKSFSLPNNDLICNITIYDRPVGANFCNDVPIAENPNLISKWNAVSGNLKLSVSDIEETEYETYYRLTILLENVVFKKNNSNEQRTIPRLIIEKANLGFLPG